MKKTGKLKIKLTTVFPRKIVGFFTIPRIAQTSLSALGALYHRNYLCNVCL